MAQPGSVRGRVSAERLRSWWEVPAIAHFCSLFRAAFALPDFEIEELEDALLIDNWDFLEDLVSKLLRGCYQRKDINIENFHMYLEDIIRHRWELEEGKENPLQGIHFRALSSRIIVEILHRLCDYRLDATDVFDLLKGLEADSLRVEALGEDNAGAQYWYFYGTRLYKELPPPPPKEEPKYKPSKNDNKKGKKLKEEQNMKNSRVLNKNITAKTPNEKLKKKWKLRYSLSKTSRFERVEKGSGQLDETSDVKANEQKENDAFGCNVMHIEERSVWSLVCHTLEEWNSLSDSFKESQCAKERKLYKILTENFISEISNLLIQKEKQLQKRLSEILPRRASDRLLVKRTQQEELVSSLLKERQAMFGRLADNRMRDGYYYAAQRLFTPQEIKHIEEEGRILAREERARRRQMREEKSMLMTKVKTALKRKQTALTHSPVNSEEPDKKRPEVHYTDDEQYVSMYKVLDAVKVHKDSWPFNEPVDESYAPDYLKIIEEPMDLSTIEKKLSEKMYHSKWAFVSDFRLMFENCEHYNGKGNEYTLMAQAVEKCFNKAMIRYFPKDEIDSDEEFSDKMMYGKRDRHKSKPNHFVKDEIKTLMDTTDDGLGTPKVNGFMSSNPASDVLQMITELKEEENPPQSILVPVQKKTTEVKPHPASGPILSSEVFLPPQAPGSSGRIVMEPIRKRFQQQYRMQQLMLMNREGASDSAGSNSASLQTPSLSSSVHGMVPLHAGVPTDSTEAQAPIHSSICGPNWSASQGLPQTEAEAPSSPSTATVPPTQGDGGTPEPPVALSRDCRGTTDLNQTKEPEWPGYLCSSIQHPEHKQPTVKPTSVSSQGVSVEHTGLNMQNLTSALNHSIFGSGNPLKKANPPEHCRISVKCSEPLPVKPPMQTSVLSTPSCRPLDQTSQRPLLKGAPPKQAAYTNVFSTDLHHHLKNKDPISNEVTSLNTSSAPNLHLQESSLKNAESDRLCGNVALKNEENIFSNSVAGDKDFDDCSREALNLVLSKAEDCEKRHANSDAHKELVRTEAELKNNLISQAMERPNAALDKRETSCPQKGSTVSRKRGSKDPKSMENLKLKLSTNAKALMDLSNGGAETVSGAHQRNPAVVAHPETRHQYGHGPGPVPAYMHYLECNPESLVSGHSFGQHAPPFMVVHPMQGQPSHFYQHPTQQQIASQLSNLNYHPQQSVHSSIMPDRGYLSGQSNLYSQSPFAFLREGSRQLHAHRKDRPDAYSDQLIPERNECKPLQETSVKKLNTEAEERRFQSSKMESSSEKANKHGRQQECLDLHVQNATQRQQVIHMASPAYNNQLTSGIYSHQVPHPALYANASTHNVQRLPYDQAYNPQLLRVHSVITSTSNHMVPPPVMNHSPVGMQLFSQSDMKPGPYPGTVIVQRPQFNTNGDLYMMRNMLPEYQVLKQMGRRDPDTMPQPQDKTMPPLCMNQP
ncbi:uncharacterized protein LOC116984565 isoform X1 [Amblyraja radiata]|uniref:uncharacterized protein LOC116984565 isoform X1 n=1 Tax=Amblyraja radiata TaxID=386614 RepID=UPI001402B8EC|nr:uncharacterized protein LOC116984565 isoform X1 [Amblyraja radiata]